MGTFFNEAAAKAAAACSARAKAKMPANLNPGRLNRLMLKPEQFSLCEPILV